jgi:hypothetical protein
MNRATSTTTTRIVGLISTTLVLNACYGWHARVDAPIPVVVAEQPDQIRVERITDPYRIVLHDPWMAGDTLVGMAGHWRARISTPIHLDQIRSIETRKLNPYATAGTLVGVVVAALGVAFLIAFMSLDCFIDCV